jgi:hypothetical protein
MSETTTQQLIRLDAAETPGVTLWRNNSGACRDETGRLIRYGLGNDSKKVNDHIKSSDLIGFQEVRITPSMVGCKLAVFTAVEVKPLSWSYRQSDARATAQLRFLHHVLEHGGRAGFARSVQEFRGILM